MKVPRYNFQIGRLKTDVSPVYKVGIDDEGEFISQSGSYAYGLAPLGSDTGFFFKFISESQYNAVFFYNKNQEFILKKDLADYNGQVIKAPSNAAFWGVRFNGADPGFAEYKNTNFLYGTSSVNPVYKDLKKKYSKENGQEFFRATLEGDIHLIGSDYDSVADSDLNSEFIFIVNKIDKDRESLFYKGRFSKTDCTFDYRKKKCKIRLSAIDQYNEILEKYDNTYDIIKLAPEITKIRANKRPLIQIYIKGANTVSNFFGGTYWESDVLEPCDNITKLLYDYHFASLKPTGSQFRIEGAPEQDINGTYAGTGGRWINSNGLYECKADMDNYSAENGCDLNICAVGSSAAVYKSSKKAFFYDASDPYLSSDMGVIPFKSVNSSTVLTPTDQFAYLAYCRLLCDVEKATISGEEISMYDVPVDDFIADNRNYKKCIGLEKTGTVFCTSRVSESPTRYGTNDGGQYFTDEFIPSSSGVGRPMPISRNAWINSSLWYVYSIGYPEIETALRKSYLLKDCYSIASIIRVLLKSIDPKISHEATPEYSQFLYGDDMPLAGLNRFYVFLTQKTNILKGEYDQPAQKAETSLEEIMGMLSKCFKCFWYIEDNKLKVEHILYFINGGSYQAGSQKIQLDCTALTDKFNRKEATYFQSEVEYDKANLAQRYELTWPDNTTELFGRVALDVDAQYVQKGKTEEILPPNFVSDIDFMLFNPSGFSEDGFALMCPILVDGQYELPILYRQIPDENGRVIEAYIQNWYASWHFLFHFYMYDFPAIRLYYNLQPLQAKSIKACMAHRIEIMSTEKDINTAELIKTEVGNGKIEEATIDLNTGLHSVKLAYRPK